MPALFHEGFIAAETIGDEIGMMMCLSALARYWQAVGDFGRSYHLFSRSRDHARQLLQKFPEHEHALTEDISISLAIGVVKRYLLDNSACLSCLQELLMHYQTKKCDFGEALVLQALGNEFAQQAVLGSHAPRGALHEEDRDDVRPQHVQPSRDRAVSTDRQASFEQSLRHFFAAIDLFKKLGSQEVTTSFIGLGMCAPFPVCVCAWPCG
jgi:hypothetical protein